MYYLQSRYYDPTLGRFINPDILVSTKHVGLSCNVFIYCNNNSVNHSDPWGFDAIWIQEKDSAAGFGHSGLMVQDAHETWFYFYWGPLDETPRLELIIGVPNGSYIEEITTNNADMRNTETVRSILAISDGNAQGRASLISNTYYFEGDYTDTLNAAQKMVDSKESYNLITNNCVQKTTAAFLASDGRFGMVSCGIANAVVPNATANQVAMLPSQKGKVPWKLGLCNLFQ